MRDPAIFAAQFPPAERTLPGLLRRQADRFGARLLFRCGNAAWTYAEMPDRAARAAAKLRGAGIVAGDRVAIMSRNRPEFLELLLGCGWLGAIAVPVNAAAQWPQLRHVLADSGARLLILEECFTGMVNPENLGTCRLWVMERMPEISVDGPPASLDQGDTLAILYTSGTTGAPKGVCCPHAQLFWWGVNTASLLGIAADDVLATALPLFHVNAMNTFWQALLHGARMVLLPSFSVSGFWEMLAGAEASVTYLLGAMVPMLLTRPQSAGEPRHRVRVALAPGVPAAVQPVFTARTGIGLIDGFGSTETNFVIGTAAEHQRPGVMGPVAPGFTARVVAADGTPVPDATPGELVLRADEPLAFATGYWNNPAATRAAWRNHWFHTGDRVVRDGDGSFRFLDRMKDTIRRRGENISSLEVEQALASHPGIAAAAAFPVPSELGEDEVMVAITAHVGAHLIPAEIIAHCMRLLPRYAVPRYVDVVASLPLTANGKVQKFALIARGVTATTWERIRKED